jgi:hypothetical protein
METLQPITTMPVPCDLAREHCEKIYEAYRFDDSFNCVDLMIRAYRFGKTVGQQEAFREVRESQKPAPAAKSDPHDDDERGILDLALEMKARIDHYDAIGADQYALARKVNGGQR